MSDIKDRLLAACNGHPTAAIPWPHRLLHDAIDQIEAQQARIAELEAERDHLERELAEYVDAAKRLAVEKAEFRREAEKLQAELAALREALEWQRENFSRLLNGKPVRDADEMMLRTAALLQESAGR